MDHKEEPIDIYDAQGHHLGTSPRPEVHRQGLWHRSFHCWIAFLSAEGEKHIVFQHRGPFKADWPNYFISAAGHYLAGEGIEGGVRELGEELGLQVAPHQLHKLGVRIIDEHLYNGSINREFQDVYFLKTRFSLSDYTLRFPEVDGICNLRLKDVRDVLADSRDAIEGRGLVAQGEEGRMTVKQVTVTRQDFIPNALDYLRLIIKLADAVLETELGLALRDQVFSATTMALPDGSRWRSEV